MKKVQIHPSFWFCVSVEFGLSAFCVYGVSTGMGWMVAAAGAVLAGAGGLLVGLWYGANKVFDEFVDFEPVEHPLPSHSPWEDR
jgi:hypothetical protein